MTKICPGWDFYQICHLASHDGTLPIVGNLSRGGTLLFYNIWRAAKNSWHAAKSTPPDPHWSWWVTYQASLTRDCPEKAYFCGFLILTFDLWHWFTKKYSFSAQTYHHAQYEVNPSNSSAFLGLWHTDGQFVGNIIIWMMVVTDTQILPNLLPPMLYKNNEWNRRYQHWDHLDVCQGGNLKLGSCIL